MSENEQDQRRKFRRVLLLRSGTGPHDWQELLEQFAEDVTHVSLDNYAGIDYLQLVADCLVIDSRIPDRDFVGVGYVFTTAQHRMLPTLFFHDERPGWDVDYMMVGASVGTRAVPFSEATALQELERFLEETAAVDYKKLYEESPWLTHPWTVTMAQIFEANARGKLHPQQLI